MGQGDNDKPIWRCHKCQAEFTSQRDRNAHSHKEEFAIQDTETGLYYQSDVSPLADDVLKSWGDAAGAKRFVSHFEAANCTAFDSRWTKVHRKSARIVEAPIREMTDAEAEAWFKTLNLTFRLYFNGGYYHCNGVPDDELGTGKTRTWGSGDSLFDAIRAARKKLEAR